MTQRIIGFEQFFLKISYRTIRYENFFCKTVYNFKHKYLVKILWELMVIYRDIDQFDFKSFYFIGLYTADIDDIG